MGMKKWVKAHSKKTSKLQFLEDIRLQNHFLLDKRKGKERGARGLSAQHSVHASDELLNLHSHITDVSVRSSLLQYLKVERRGG